MPSAPPSASSAASPPPFPSDPDENGLAASAGLDVPGLAEELRQARFKVSLQQVIAAQRLLVQLAAKGKIPEDPAQIATLLGPIFCASPEDQQRFPGLFDRWHRGRTRPTGQRPEPALPQLPTPSPRRPPARLARLSWRALVACAVGIVVFLTVDHWWLRTLSGRVFEEANPRRFLANVVVRTPHGETRSDTEGRFRLRFQKSQLPFNVDLSLTNFIAAQRRISRTREAALGELALVRLPPTTPTATPASGEGEETWIPPTASPPAFQQTRVLRLRSDPEWQSLILAWVPLGLALLWLWFRGRRRRPVLERLRDGTPNVLREIHVAGAIRNLFPSLPVPQLAREMRRRRLVESRQLDLNATLAASVRRGGLFTPRYGTRVEPEYLVLIDRVDPADHQARLADALVASLEHSNVSVERFFFEGDPTFCQLAPPRHQPWVGSRPPPTFSLEELCARYPEHRVLVITDGSGCFDPFSGEPSAWLAQLDRWPDRLLMTPESPDRWARREAALQRLGYRVLPLNQAGIAAHIELLRGHPVRPFGSERAAVQAVPGFARNPRQWLDRLSPPAEVIAELCGELKLSLGTEGFDWLAACAVYPEIHWGLTVRLGFGLIAAEPEVERLLPKLSRLVWFRYGFMPDWLRAALLARISPTASARSRALVLEILQQAGEPQRETVALRIALPEPPTGPSTSTVARAWNFIRQLGRLGAAQRLANTARQASAESPLRDYVFLRFAGGESGPGLTTEAPPLWLRLLYPEGVRSHGTRTGLWLGAALALAILVSINAILPSTKPLTTVAWSPNGALVATGDAAGRVKLWNATNGAPTGVSFRLSGAITALAFSPTRGQLAAGCESGTVVVRQLDAGTTLVFSQTMGGAVQAVAFHPTQPSLAVANASGAPIQLGVWPISDQEAIHSLVGRRGDPRDALALSYDAAGTTLRVGYRDGAIESWDVANGDRPSPRDPRESVPYLGAFANENSRSLWLSITNGLRLESDHEAPVSEPAQAIENGRLTPLPRELAHPQGVVALALAPAGDRFLTAGRDGTLAYWNVTSERQTYVLQIAYDGTTASAKQAPGVRLANAIRDVRAVARVWQDTYGTGVLRLENPSLDRVTNALDRIVRWAHSNDLVILQLSGHGSQGPQREYRFPLGTSANAAFLDTATLAQFSRRLKAQELLLLVDTVYGETLVGRATANAYAGPEQGPTRMVLSSASAGQYASDGASGSGSPFAIALERVLGLPNPPSTGAALYEATRRLMQTLDRNAKDPQRPSYGPFLSGGHARGDIRLPAPQASGKAAEKRASSASLPITQSTNAPPEAQKARNPAAQTAPTYGTIPPEQGGGGISNGRNLGTSAATAQVAPTNNTPKNAPQTRPAPKKY